MLIHQFSMHQHIIFHTIHAIQFKKIHMDIFCPTRKSGLLKPPHQSRFHFFGTEIHGHFRPHNTQNHNLHVIQTSSNNTQIQHTYKAHKDHFQSEISPRLSKTGPRISIMQSQFSGLTKRPLTASYHPNHFKWLLNQK